jgi:hypothetical protein
MLRRLPSVLCMLLLCACSGKKQDRPPARPPDAAPAFETAAMKPTEINVRCERILTKDLLDRFFPGRVLGSGGPNLETWNRTCTIGAAGQPMGTTIQVSCGDPYVNDESMKAQMAQAARQGFQNVPELGRWAARRGDELRLWDEDAPCLFSIARFQPAERLVELARALEVSTTDASFDRP